MGQICCNYSNLCGPGLSRDAEWFWLWEINVIFLHGQKKPKPDLSFAFQHLSLLVLFLFPFWITRLRSQDDLWMRSAYQNDCFFVFLLLAVLLMLVSSLFLLYKVLWSRRWRLSVEMLQCHGMSLFCVWTLSMPLISIRACWRELRQYTTTSGNLALPYITINHKYHNQVSLFLAILTIKVGFSPPRLHGDLVECSGYACLIEVACWLVFYPGGPVSMCRHVRVPPISDCALILYKNYSFV